MLIILTFIFLSFKVLSWPLKQQETKQSYIKVHSRFSLPDLTFWYLSANGVCPVFKFPCWHYGYENRQEILNVPCINGNVNIYISSNWANSICWWTNVLTALPSYLAKWIYKKCKTYIDYIHVYLPAVFSAFTGTSLGFLPHCCHLWISRTMWNHECASLACMNGTHWIKLYSTMLLVKNKLSVGVVCSDELL